MPPHLRSDVPPGVGPWGGVPPRGHALPPDALNALGRLTASLAAATPPEFAEAWLAQATALLPVRALHLALREGGETRIWSSTSDAPLTGDWRQVEDAIDTGEPSVAPLEATSASAGARLVAPISGGARPIGALIADAAPEAASQVLGVLEAVRWPLGLRLIGLMETPGAGRTAARGVVHGLCEGLHRCETLTDLLGHLLGALPGLVGADWAAVAACDPQGRVLHVTSLDGPDPVGPEGWARAASATGVGNDGRTAPLCLSTTVAPNRSAWVLPLRADRSPLRYILAVGGNGAGVDRAALPLLEDAAAHAEVGLARILATGELRLALDAHARVVRVTQLVTALNRGESPTQVLGAAMDAMLREPPGLAGGALHRWAGEELVHEQSAGAVPPALCRGAGLAWWQERLAESVASRLPGYWHLPQGHGSDTILVTMPILSGGAGGSEDRVLGVVSVFATSLETVDLALRATLGPFAHVLAQLVLSLEHLHALERANHELEQRKAQIIESKGALEAILDGFPDGLFIVDRDLRVTLSNDVQALRIRGSGPATGQYCWELFGSGDGVCPGCRVMDTLKKGISTRRRVHVHRPGQSRREWEVATHPIARRSAKSTQAALVIVRDVTEQEQVAKSLAQVEKLAAVGRLAAGIAHEINNPLAAIQANVQLLLGATPTGDQVESLEIMRRATERARRVVRNLLSFTDQSLGYLAPVDVNATIRAALDLVSLQCQRGGVTLECRLAENLPSVMASQEQLESVWLNLALNALDAVLEGGAAGRIEVTSEAAPSGWIRVTVRDNGPGLPPGRLPHVFEPFGSNSSPTVGTGLGLFSCHNVVKRHGGSIQAGAGEGGGSRFEVSLPALVEDADDPDDAADDGPVTAAGAA